MSKKDKGIFIGATAAFAAVMLLGLMNGNYKTLMMLALIAYAGYGIYIVSKLTKQKKAKTNVRLERYGATLTGTLKHISGLPLAKNVLVDMYYGPEKITFRKGGEEIKVAREKVTSIDLVSAGNNARNAMAGAASGKYVLGGTTGAVVGSLASMKYNLVISYVSDGKSKSITLDIASSGTFAQKVVKDFGQTAKVRHNSVEL